MLTEEGMCVDAAIHLKVGNPHAHLMCTTRKIKADGTWDQKEKKVYALDEFGNKIPVIDPEKCIECGKCVGHCGKQAIHKPADNGKTV